MKKPWMVLKGGGNIVFLSTFLFYLPILTGCQPTISSPEQIREFEKVGLIGIEESNTPTRIKTYGGLYQVVPGDVLELHIPSTMRAISTKSTDFSEKVELYLCRVSDAGTIVLPIVGNMMVAGDTLAEIESKIVDSYYPKYVVSPPMVICEVKKYRRENERVFTVLGLVNRPNAFPYPPDVRYSLMEALAYAGGLDMIADPRYLKIYRQDSGGRILCATLGVDSGSLASACNIAIRPGDVIYVDHTLRTRTNKFLSDVFRITVGADIRANNE